MSSAAAADADAATNSLSSSSSSSFSWDRLPITIQETILSLLPISTLISCKSVSRSWRSTIQSPAFTTSYPNHLRRPDDLIFPLFYDQHRCLAAAYRPSLDRWFHLPLPRPVIAGRSLLLATNSCPGRIAILDPLAPFCPILSLPSIPTDRFAHPYIVALIENLPNYMILAVNTTDSKVYDSRSGHWENRGQLPGLFAMLGNTAFLDGLLFCLSHGPNHLLTFDTVGGGWSILDVAMPVPSVVCTHILAYRGELFLAAGVEEVGVIARIGIWELNRVGQSGKEWEEIGFMPDDYFSEFGTDSLEYFETVDRAGMVCFYNRAAEQLLMFDLPAKRWWWPRPCDVPMGRKYWIGHALEFRIHLLE